MRGSRGGLLTGSGASRTFFEFFECRMRLPDVVELGSG